MLTYSTRTTANITKRPCLRARSLPVSGIQASKKQVNSLISCNSKVAKVDENTFHSEVIDSDKPVIVDFWAPWCGPCKLIAPVIESVANEYGDRIKFVKVDTDESQDIASRHGVRNIPCLMLFSGGKKRDTLVGVYSKEQIVNFMESRALMY
mmetsp:Transcript_27944/g.51624  ORF Transcript_27944/g.51624 Transcript_27944/m.51624 type:complete len:152 (-) Transcript_27944:112-567(-)